MANPQTKLKQLADEGYSAVTVRDGVRLRPAKLQFGDVAEDVMRVAEKTPIISRP